MQHPLTDGMITEITGLFAALGDGSRLRLLRALLDAEAPLSQGAAADASGLSQANASKHLACLVRVGLVSRHQQGNTVFFAPVLPLVADLCGLVCDHAADRARTTLQSLH